MTLEPVALKFTHVTQNNIDDVINIIRAKHATEIELDLFDISAAVVNKLQDACPDIAINKEDPNLSPVLHGFGLFTLKDLMPPRDPYAPEKIKEEFDMEHYQHSELMEP